MESTETQNIRQQTENPPLHLNDVRIGGKDTTDGAVMFRQIPLDESGEKPKRKKVPRRVLHFSDGVLEEYSTDEEEQEPPPPEVDPKTLTWAPWFWYHTTSSAAKALGVADFCGEKLAWFFGITSPKYQFAIDEYNRIKAEEQREREEEEREREAERRRLAEAMAGMEGAVNTVNPGESAGETSTRGGPHNTSYTNNTPATVTHEKF